MKEKQTTTGYPYIDKPWLKYYSEGNVHKIDLCNTIYSNFLKIANRKPDSLAFIDFNTGLKTTYSQLLQQVDNFANGLVAMGICEGSKIGVLGFNSLVDPVAVLGGNKIGATVFFVDPGEGIPGIAKNIDWLDVLILENIFSEMEPAINQRKIPVIVYGESSTSFRSNCIDYKRFIDKGSSYNVLSSEYQDEHPALVVFSSGTTGAPKPIVHSNYTVNAAVLKMLYSDFPITENNFLIKAIPSHIGLGIITTLLTALLAGIPYIQLKGFPDPVLDLLGETSDLISNYKKWLAENGFDTNTNLLLFAAPVFAKFILKEIDKFDDLSFLSGILLGGSKMTKEELDLMDAVFATKGLKVPICNGYGQNEMAGAVALNTVSHNKNGSAGYPVYDTNIRIVNRYTLEDVSYNTIGQILEQSDSRFLYYLGMSEKTEKAKIILSDGSEWYDSTDLGYMDEDGFLFITGRTTRVVIKDDHKVSMDVIEEKIKNIDFVREVAVVPSVVEGDVIVFICLRKQKTVSADKIMDLLKTEQVGLSIFEVPVHIETIDELPRMNNGKVDYMKLGEMAKKIKIE